MSISMIITTSLFEVYFSRDKQGRDNTNFNVEEKDAIRFAYEIASAL